MKLKPIIAAISVALLSSPAQAAQRYSVTDMGTLGGVFSSAQGINDNGLVVGYFTSDSNDDNNPQGSSGSEMGYIYGGDVPLTPNLTHGFSSNGRTFTDLGIFGNGTSYANAVNNGGKIVGQYFPNNGGYQAFVYSQGTITDLGTMGGSETNARDINDSSQIVGYFQTKYDLAVHAFLYSDGNLVDLGTLGGDYSSANSINNSGQIVGTSSTADFNNHAFLYSDGNMVDIGTLGGGYSSSAKSINNSGQIVGASGTADFNTHAFLFSDGNMVDLGTLGGSSSTANDINTSGQVVGASTYVIGDSAEHAFLYSDGGMTDLNSLIDPLSGWVITDASDINSSGQIIATGYGAGYDSRTLLLTPVPVPEPATYAMLLAGLGLVGGQAWRRRASAAKKVEA